MINKNYKNVHMQVKESIKLIAKLYINDFMKFVFISFSALDMIKFCSLKQYTIAIADFVCF